MQQVAVERNAGIQQPVEGGAGQARHHGIAQGHDVVLADFSFQQRTFANPSARGHAGQRGHLAFGVAHRNLDQPRQYAYPCLGEFAFALYDRSGNHLLHGKVSLDARLLLAVEHAKPGRGELQGVG
ncbi:hypothetical protein D3C85_1527120 [compost metagenome]